MLPSLRARLSYANVMATIAVFVALGGGAYAATLPRNSVGPAQLRANSVGASETAVGSVASPEVRDFSLLARDFRAGQLPAGAPGANGANGTNGTNGTNGLNGVDAVAPAGAVMFFNLAACPAGWTEYTEARGRYLVGLPAGGTPGLNQGQALSSGENRAVGVHQHALPVPVHDHGGLLTTVLENGTAGSVTGLLVGSRSTSNPTTAHLDIQDADTNTFATENGPSGAVAGTPAPYRQLLVCQKA